MDPRPTAIIIKVVRWLPGNSTTESVFLAPDGTTQVGTETPSPQAVHRRGLWSALNTLVMFREKAPWPIQRVELTLDPETVYHL